ncbi:peptidoglycan amidohydrolase family protein [Enterococcus rivorum]|uniref:peptidoglycan amidohydrolase family protein n=1 Tax=Enterococcus rivorum TaxID=762845 RepID=UPI00362F5581
MANTESVINWFRAREGKVTYSMTNRYGPYSYDCSSAVYNALIEAGFLPVGTAIGNTETLYALDGSLLQPISRSQASRGDIISGGKGTSLGGNGHTGVFVSNSRIIHCNYGSNGISETSTENGWMGGPPSNFYRLKGGTTTTETEKNGIAIDNISFDQAKHMVAWIQTKYSWTLLREQVKADKQSDGRYKLVIKSGQGARLNNSLARLQQELRTYYPGYMQQNIAVIDGDKSSSCIEARNMSASAFTENNPFDLHMRNFLKDILLDGQTYGEKNSYGTWDVRVKGEGFNNHDTPIVKNEIEAEVRKTGANAFAVKSFKY